MTPSHRLSLENIAEAARTIDPVFLHSPQFMSEGLSKHFGCSLTLKLETANPIGSFKGRGASFYVDQMVAAGNVTPMVCASAGNFGQAMAYACRTHGLPLIVFASIHANPLKIAKMRAFGAEVRLAGEDFDAAKLAAANWASENGASMVEDGRQPEISEGAGSIGVELLAAGKPFDAILLPLGNGALLTGVARWIRAHSPATQVIAVSSVHAAAMHDSFKSGHIVEYQQAPTIADGIAVRVPIPEAVEDMKGIVDDVLLVEEASILEAMKLVLQHERLIVEPAGVVGIAALLEHPKLNAHNHIATVLCGNNLTEDQIRTWLVG